MASSLQFYLVTVAILLLIICFPGATTNSPSTSPHDTHNLFAQMPFIEPILKNLGFHELVRVVPSLYDNPASCSVFRLLREPTVPGLHSHSYLSKVALGSKFETLDHGRCITVTSSTDADNYSKKVFIGGAEITRPDLFNNGLVIVHGIKGYVGPLSLHPCNEEEMVRPLSLRDPAYVMRLMLKDATMRLQNSGFGIVALVMRLKSLNLLNLENMTVFAIDDESIFSGSG